MNQERIKELYTEAVTYCSKQPANSDGTNRAWLWEVTFAEFIIKECAKIAKDCYEYHEPLSKVPKHILNFKRLSDEDLVK